ncbi:hypothetical protein, partial [Nocardioides sp.]|uniref:hypothetical protein n=1 Tax=Nocardioides sp. TaxID=35761 RepID=UPI00321AA1E0
DLRRVEEDLHDASGLARARRVASAGAHDASALAGAGRRLDVLQHTARPRLTDPHRVIGAKPAVFCRWVFDLLGATPVDEFEDVFPGSGGVQRAWDTFTAVARDASSLEETG